MHLEKSEKIGLSVAAAAHALLLWGLIWASREAPTVVMPPSMTVDIVSDADVSTAAEVSTAAPAPGVGTPDASEVASAPPPEPVVAPPSPPVTPAPPAVRPTPPKPTPAKPAPPTPRPQPDRAAEQARQRQAQERTAQQARERAATQQRERAAEQARQRQETARREAATRAANERAAAQRAAATRAANERAAAQRAAAQRAQQTRGTGSGSARNAPSNRPARGLGDIANDVARASGTSRNPPATQSAAQMRQAFSAAIDRELAPVWQRNIPSGVDVERLRVTLEITFNRNGSVASVRQVGELSGKTESNAPQQALFVERAIRAVRQAAPYNLPAEHYDQWRVMRQTFSARRG